MPLYLVLNEGLYVGTPNKTRFLFMERINNGISTTYKLLYTNQNYGNVNALLPRQLIPLLLCPTVLTQGLVPVHVFCAWRDDRTTHVARYK